MLRMAFSLCHTFSASSLRLDLLLEDVIYLWGYVAVSFIAILLSQSGLREIITET